MPPPKPAAQAPGSAAPGGRPTAKSARTRERLVNAAAVTLSRRGYAGTRLADVAEEAGLQAPAVYYYFESRDQLIEEVVVVGTVRLREYVRSALAAAPASATPLDRVDLAVEAHLRQLLGEASFAHAVIRNLSQLPDDLRARQRAEERKYAATWRSLIRAVADEGALRPDLDPEITRLLIVGTLNWVTEWWEPKRGSIDSVVAMAQSIVRHGIAEDRAV